MLTPTNFPQAVHAACANLIRKVLEGSSELFPVFFKFAEVLYPLDFAAMRRFHDKQSKKISLVMLG